jgi:metal-responsive CopG/Arc/MetJ family transcriptional regulator
MGRTKKLTVTLPEELISVADHIAREKKISRSKVISACLADLAQKQKEALLAEGYQYIAREQKQFGAAVSEIALEIMPEWKDAR